MAHRARFIATYLIRYATTHLVAQILLRHQHNLVWLLLCPPTVDIAPPPKKSPHPTRTGVGATAPRTNIRVQATPLAASAQCRAVTRCPQGCRLGPQEVTGSRQARLITPQGLFLDYGPENVGFVTIKRRRNYSFTARCSGAQGLLPL